MKRALVLVFLVAGCAGDVDRSPPIEALVTPAARAAAEPEPLPVVEVAEAEPLPPPPPPPPPAPPMLIALPPDTCGSRPLLALIGQPRTAIPVSGDLSRRRVTCVGCPIDLDFRADRITILFDADSGLITDVKCG